MNMNRLGFVVTRTVTATREIAVQGAHGGLDVFGTNTDGHGMKDAGENDGGFELNFFASPALNLLQSYKKQDAIASITHTQAIRQRCLT